MATDDNNLSAHNQTIPTTVGALLTEECTIDPLSHLPSFLELTFVDVARSSSRKALAAAWGVGVAWLEGTLERLRRLEGRLSGERSNGEHSPSRFRLLRVVRALIVQLGRVRVRVLRRLCHAFLGTAKTLGPELQALVMYAIDYNCVHYLAGATGCEMVYGLKRSKIVKVPRRMHTTKMMQSEASEGQSRVTELSKFEKTCSALFATLLPYCKDRCDRTYSEWKEQQSIGGPVYRTSSRNRIAIENSKLKILQIYPYFHMVHEGSIFLYQFAYLMGYTHYWSFSLHTLGVMLRRMTVADVQQQQQKHLQTQQQLKGQPKGGGLPSPQTTQLQPQTKRIPFPTNISVPQLLRGALFFSVSYALLSGWYSHFQRQLRLRRRRWIAGDESPWQAHEGETNDEGESGRRNHLPNPPPPMPPNMLDEDNLIMDKWSCPICKEPRINPTASTSGYVFCYKCLVMHLREKGEYCPMTGMHCPENRVVRLYEPTASRGVVAGQINGTPNK